MTEDEVAREARYRLARVQLVIGVASAAVVLLGVVFAFLLEERPLGGVPFWALIGGVVAVFVAYFWWSVVSLRRHGSPKRQPPEP